MKKFEITVKAKKLGECGLVGYSPIIKEFKTKKEAKEYAESVYYNHLVDLARMWGTTNTDKIRKKIEIMEIR
jgi:hypothetical protein